MKYKNDKHLNEVLGYVTHECQYYDQMDVKNREYASVQEDDKHHNMKVHFYKLPYSMTLLIIKNKKVKPKNVVL